MSTKTSLFLLLSLTCCICLSLSKRNSSLVFTHKCGENCDLCIEGNEKKCLLCKNDEMVITNVTELNISLGYYFLRYSGECVREAKRDGAYLKYHMLARSLPYITYHLKGTNMHIFYYIECPSESFLKGENGICCPIDAHCLNCTTSDHMGCTKCLPNYVLNFMSPISSLPTTPYLPDGGICMNKCYGGHQLLSSDVFSSPYCVCNI